MNEDVLISHLTKTFGERHLFVDQSLLLRRNHINLLLGRNGVGKTTLLSILASQQQSDTPPKNIPPKVILFPERLALIDNISGLSNIQFILYSVGLKVKDSDVRYAAKLLELDILALKVPTVEYSLGMREKIKMILFFLIKCDFFFLFDEPLSALDQKSLTISIDMMRESNKFVLMCTHSPTIAKGVMTGYANVLTHHKIIQQKGSTPDDQI